jgi:CRISPR-associated protein Csh1
MYTYMDIKKNLKEIENKIVSLEELSEDEFFILAGQIIKYLLTQSEKKDKRADMIEPFLRAGKVKKLKQEIETLYFTYKHKIFLDAKKFNNALALVESFEGNKVKKDKLLVGILSENIFYKKDEK